jgi:hypothetical protein
MKSPVLVSVVSAFFLALLAVPASAQATRTWISGVGDDANPCSRTAPCKTFAGAISKTAAGGEIDNLDAGGFGALTITKSITLDGGGGSVASILVASTNGINVTAASTDVVIIRNLRFQGSVVGNSTSGAGLTAIQLNTAANVIIENCDITGFANNGIAVVPGSSPMRVSISNTHIQNVAFSTGNAGVLVAPAAGVNANVTIANSYVEQALNGIFANGGSSGAINLNVKNSTLTSFGNAGVAVASTGATVAADVFGTIINYANGAGAAVAGTNATLKLGRDSITGNVTGVSGSSPALQSFKDNDIADNGTNGTPITAVSGYTNGGQ